MKKIIFLISFLIVSSYGLSFQDVLINLNGGPIHPSSVSSNIAWWSENSSFHIVGTETVSSGENPFTFVQGNSYTGVIIWAINETDNIEDACNQFQSIANKDYTGEKEVTQTPWAEEACGALTDPPVPDTKDTTCSTIETETGYSTESQQAQLIEVVTTSTGEKTFFDLGVLNGSCSAAGKTQDCLESTSGGVTFTNINVSLLGGEMAPESWVPDSECFDRETLQQKTVEEIKEDLKDIIPVDFETINNVEYEEWRNDYIDDLRDKYPEYDPRHPDHPQNPNNPEYGGNGDNDDNDDIKSGLGEIGDGNDVSNSDGFKGLGTQLEGIGSAVKEGNSQNVDGHLGTQKAIAELGASLVDENADYSDGFGDGSDFSEQLEGLRNQNALSEAEKTAAEGVFSNVSSAFGASAQKLNFQLPTGMGTPPPFNFGNIGGFIEQDIVLDITTINLPQYTRIIFMLSAWITVFGFCWTALLILLKSFNNCFS